MADEASRRPLLNPVLRFTKDPRPEGIAGGGKGPSGIQQGRLVRQRKVLSEQLHGLAMYAIQQPKFANKAVIHASMFDDSLAPTWTPNDLFRPDRGAQLLAPYRTGYLVEVDASYLGRLARLVETATVAKDLVDISRVQSIRFHEASDVFGGSSAQQMWENAPVALGGRMFLLWLMPLTDPAAAEQLLATFQQLRQETILPPPDMLSTLAAPVDRSPLGRSLRTLGSTDRLARVMRDYRFSQRARTTIVLPSVDALNTLTASGTVYRLEPVSPITVTAPGIGREPDRPLPDSLDDEPIVGVVDGGMNASSYRPAEAWTAPPLVATAAADILHGNRISSIVVQGHDWNNNLALPELYCRIGTVPVISKPGYPGADPEALVAYLDAVIGAHPETRVWNLSFNQGRECEEDAVSFLGHALAEVARKHRVLLVNSIGNQPGACLKAPADCEAALTVGGRLHTADGMPAGPCGVALTGPGPSGMLKPDVAHFSHVRALGGSLHQGSSFSAALVSPLAAHTLANLREADPDLAKALLIHTTDGEGFDPAIGFGTPRAASLPWECTAGSVTLQWRATLRARAAYYWELPIPPVLLVGDRLRGRGRLTAILNPHPMVTDFAGPNYFSARLNTALQVPRGKGFTNLLGSMDTDRVPEHTARMVDHKWSPIRDHARDFRRIGVRADGNLLRIYARIYTRDHYLYGYNSADEIPQMDAVFVLTLRSITDTDEIYNQTRAMLGNFVESAVIDTDIELDADG
jgi:hypothetical protein